MFSCDLVIYLWGLCITAAGKLCEGWGQQVRSSHEKKKILHGSDSRRVKKGRPDAANDWVGGGDG